MQKKYYWLKLKNDFFMQPKIKKLRRIAGGDTYTCIYLKLMLLVIQSDGILEFEGIEPTIEEEIALKIDENEENVTVALNFLFAQKLLIEIANNVYEISEVQNLIGTETAAAERKRRQRTKEKLKNVTLSQSGHSQVTKCHTEIEIESEKEAKLLKKENKSFFTTKVKVH